MMQPCRARPLNISVHTRARAFHFPLEAVRVERSRHLNLSKASRLFAGNGLAILYCEGATALSVASGLCGLWCPLKGDVRFMENGAHFNVPKRFVYVSDCNRPYDAEIPATGACIAIVAPQATWSALSGFGSEAQSYAPAVFPALHASDPQMRRSLIALARESFRGQAEKPASSRRISMLASIAGRLQQPFESLVQSCPGRTIARQRGVFLRMQRTRLHIELYNSMELDVSMLAHMANYSVWQFIKIFRQVFGETPHAYLARCRVEVATLLLRSRHSMGVADVARAAGFASRSAFSRNMKQISGSSATKLRASANDDLPEQVPALLRSAT